MRKLIFGIGEFAQLFFSHLNGQEKNEVEAFVVDAKYLNVSECLGKPVIAYETLKDLYLNESLGFYLLIGYTHMNQVRAEIFRRLDQDGHEILTYIHPEAKVYSTDMGRANLFFPGCFVDKFTTLGDANIFYSQSFLAHHTHIGSFNFFAVCACVAGNCSIENNCFFGANSTIKNGITIRESTLVGAGCYLSCDTQEQAVIVPALSTALANKKSREFL